MTEHKLADTLKMTPAEALKIINSFFSKIPKVKQLLDHFENFAAQHGYITTAKPYLRRRWFPETEQARMKGDSYALGAIGRKGKNTPIQGTNGDLIKLALVNIFELIEDKYPDVNIVMSVYDEIQTECPADLAEEWRAVLETEMIKAGELVVKSVPVVADCEISDYWKK